MRDSVYSVLASAEFDYMNTEEFFADLGHIRGLADPSPELERFQEFLRLEETEWSGAALAYIRQFVIPTLAGVDCSKRQVPFAVSVQLFRSKKSISWIEWLDLFPDTAIEVREDREGGQTLLLGLPYDPEWALKRKAGVFYSPNGFNPEPSAGHKSRRSIDNVKKFNAVWADFDVGEAGKDGALSVITKLPLTPSIVVETRNGFHVIYRLKGPWTLQEWQSVQTGLVEATKSDKACKDASRLLRMPGSWHCKDMWKGGEPYLVKAIWLTEKEYGVEELKNAYENKVMQKSHPRGPAGFSTDFSESRPKWDSVRTPQPTTLPSGQRHGTLLGEAGRLYANLDAAKAGDARAMLKEWYKRSSQPLKQNWEKEADDVSDYCEQREFGQIISR